MPMQDLSDLPPPALIIFDWDDTLVDSYAAIHAAINATRSAFGLPVWTLDEARTNCRVALKESFPVWFGDEWEKARDIFYETFAAAHIAKLQPKPFADELLAALARRHVPLAVNSNKKSLYLREEIAHLGWERHFAVVVGADDVAHGKPAPDGVVLIRRDCGLHPEQAAWFVGDNNIDEETAYASGCHAIIIGQAKEKIHGKVVFLPSLRELYYAARHDRG